VGDALQDVTPGVLKLTALAKDAAGNQEKLPRVISITVTR
jgi:hypothetical protein